MNKLAAALAFVLAFFVATPGLALAPANAADDDYTAAVRTSCHLDMPAIVRVNHAPRITITVRPNGPVAAAGNKAARAAAARAEQPTGTVDLSITRNGTGIFAKSVSYNGRPVTILGPVITEPGHYVVHAKFHAADGTVFRDCQATDAFDVGKRPGPPPPPPHGGPPPGGVLPDTGGPNVLWLIIALAAIGLGGGLVVASKRKPPKPLYDL